MANTAYAKWVAFIPVRDGEAQIALGGAGVRDLRRIR